MPLYRLFSLMLNKPPESFLPVLAQCSDDVKPEGDPKYVSRGFQNTLFGVSKTYFCSFQYKKPHAIGNISRFPAACSFCSFYSVSIRARTCISVFRDKDLFSLPIQAIPPEAWRNMFHALSGMLCCRLHLRLHGASQSNCALSPPAPA